MDLAQWSHKMTYNKLTCKSTTATATEHLIAFRYDHACLLIRWARSSTAEASCGHEAGRPRLRATFRLISTRICYWTPTLILAIGLWTLHEVINGLLLQVYVVLIHMRNRAELDKVWLVLRKQRLIKPPRLPFTRYQSTVILVHSLNSVPPPPTTRHHPPCRAYWVQEGPSPDSIPWWCCSGRQDHLC